MAVLLQESLQVSDAYAVRRSETDTGWCLVSGAGYLGEAGDERTILNAGCSHSANELCGVRRSTAIALSISGMLRSSGLYC